MTTVDLKLVGYIEQSFVLAKDVTQVFYVKDPGQLSRRSIMWFFKKKERLSVLRMLSTKKTATNSMTYLLLERMSNFLSLMTLRKLPTYVATIRSINRLMKATFMYFVKFV